MEKKQSEDDEIEKVLSEAMSVIGEIAYRAAHSAWKSLGCIPEDALEKAAVSAMMRAINNH